MSSSLTHSGRLIDVDVHIKAPPKRVFAAWAEPEQIARWFVDQAEGRPAVGKAIYWTFEAFGVRHPVPVVEVVEGRRLCFGGDLYGRPAFLQELTFDPEDGGTRFRLLNSGFGDGEEWDDEFAAVESGWHLALQTLKTWLERDVEHPRRHLLQMRPAVFEFDAVHADYHTLEGLRRWVAEDGVVDGDSSAAELQPGSALRWTVDDRVEVEATVLVRTAREVLLDWPAANGLLALKCFTMQGKQRAVCLDLNAWPLPKGWDRRLERWMTLALNRLVNRLEGLGPARLVETRRDRPKFL